VKPFDDDGWAENPCGVGDEVVNPFDDDGWAENPCGVGDDVVNPFDVVRRGIGFVILGKCLA